MKEKQAEFKLNVTLDENNIPKQMQWSAPEGGVENQSTTAALLSFWDEDAQEVMKMDLWVKDMPLHQMKIFFHQTLLSMAETYHKATQDEKLTDAMRNFCNFFIRNASL